MIHSYLHRSANINSQLPADKHVFASLHVLHVNIHQQSSADQTIQKWPAAAISINTLDIMRERPAFFLTGQATTWIGGEKL